MAVINSFVSVCIVAVFCVLTANHGIHSAKIRYRRQSISYDRELTHKSFPEDSGSNTILYDLNSVDIDGKLASTINFKIVKNQDSKPPTDKIFQVDSQRRVTFAQGLTEEERSKNFDYEQYPQIVIIVQAGDENVKLIKLTIPLTDVNDELPVLENKPVPYLAAVPQSPKEGATIYELLAEDPDTNADIVYSIDSSKATSEITRLFRMDQVEEGVGADKKVVGHIKVATRTELVVGNKYDIPVRIEDQNGRFPQIISANVEVLVGPRAPQFYEEKYKGSIFETKINDNPVNTYDDSSAELIVKVRSFQGNFPKTFEILEDNNRKSSRFSINDQGRIFNKDVLDYDIEVSQRPPIFNLLIKVIETLTDGTQLENTVPLEIEVKDENDNPPRFQYSQYQETVPEDAAIGSTILRVFAEDEDSGKNAEVTYELDNPYFAIQKVVEGGKTIGVITVKDNLDYDAAPGPIYRFLVLAKDGGTPSFTSSVDVIITTSNVNDNKPTIQTPGDVVLRDKVDVSKEPFFLARIRAQDADSDGVQFYLDDNGQKVTTLDIFQINPSSGVIVVFKPVPSGKDSYLLKVIAEDDGSCCDGNTRKSSSIEFLVEIVDSINQKPTFDNCLNYNPSFKEMSSPGTNVVTVSATDNDRGLNKIVRYTIVSPNPSMGNAPFKINATTGQITIKSEVNREQQAENFIQVTVKATDMGESPQEGWCTFRVQIEDINDNSPVFNTKKYTQDVSSKTAVGKVLLRVGATDKDIGPNADLTYTLENDGGGVFGIYPDSGLIYLKNGFKAGQPEYNVTVKAEDKGDPVLSGTVLVIIKVTSQEASNPPEFIPAPDKQYRVAETAPTGYKIAELTCISKIETDPRVQFFLVREDGQLSSQTVGKFSIRTPTASSNKVSLFVASDLDYETQQQHIVTLRCQNFAALTMYEQIQITIDVQDMNDEVPTFPGWIENGRYQAGVLENQAPGSIVIKDIQADDRDISSAFNKVTYSIDNSSYAGVLNDFSITTVEGKGEIRTKKEFNREVKDRYILIINANDISPSDLPTAQPGMPNSATVVVQVTIEDENDNAMVFKQSLYNHTVKETANIGFVIFPVTADDPDEVDQGKLLYNFEQPNIPFDIRDRTGEIFVTGKLDYEIEPRNYLLTLKARDSLNRFSATTQVEITLTDENDNIPVFSPNEYEVTNVEEEDETITPENPRSLVVVKATDKDTSRTKKITYNLLGAGTEQGSGQQFTINSDTGEIFLIAPLDRDKPRGKAEYIFTVEALDEEIDPQKGYANVKVFPIDKNDNKPVFERDSLSESILENLKEGSFVAQVKANDADAGPNALLTYEIIKSPATADNSKTNYFRIEKNGRVTTQVDGKYLDRETMPYLEVLVRATDQGSPPQSDTATLTIRLLDENDNAPKFGREKYSVTMSEHTTSGVILDVQATDDDIDENALLSFSIEDNDHFKIDTVNNKGYISIIPNQQMPIDYENPAMRNFILTISVKDSIPTHVDTAIVNITVEDFNDEAPKFIQEFKEVHISEGEQSGRNVTVFTAEDRDSGINAELSYSIQSSSDPRREFLIDEDSGVVFTRKSLDRETAAIMEVIILAIDKGDPQLTGSATMRVIVDDINDNFPIFREDYMPVVMENGGASDLPLEIFGKDLDTPKFGPPFGFSLPPGCNTPACTKFSLSYDPNGDNGDGTATVSTTFEFDREEQKYYELPIIMWDMRGSGDPVAQTGTNTLTITIGDVNDNIHRPGHQEVFVYNYKGTFGPLVIGRVYVEDKDDWDLPDKDFTFISPATLQGYFSVDLGTGDITMQKGVASNFGEEPYTFSVKVYDKKFDATVVSTVSVTVMELTEEAVANSGGVRFEGMTSSEFILEPVSLTGKKSDSLYTKFRKLLAEKLGYPMENVEIVNLRDGDNYLEVRYSAHASPYLSPAELDNIIVMNQAEFENLGLKVSEVPIDECLDEIFEGGCYNKLTITGNPVTVNANGTSYVGVEAFMVATQGCEADVFPESNECTGDYCHNGGQCIKDDWGNLQCINCPPGYSGSRCQETRHSFDGSSVAMYRTLTQCEESQTSIEFITEAEDGVILYNGPLKNVPQTQDAPKDFIILMLKGGYPVLRIDHGTGPAELTLDGKDNNGKQLLQKLNDGKWHHIDINRKGKEVELVVDRCAVAETNLQVVEDDRACRVRKETPKENMYLNVNTLLQLGGIMLLENNVDHLSGLTLTGFDGCLRNFIHNKRLYDLHVKQIANIDTGTNGCPREDAICNPPPNNTPRCGPHGQCEATLSGVVTCTCDGGHWGKVCDKTASIRDYMRGSYYLWEMKESFFNRLTRNRDITVHIMFRTRQTEGALVVMEDTSSSSATQHIRLMLEGGDVKLMYNLGEKDKELVLVNSTANDGQWHTVSMERYGTEFHLRMDNGEGKNYAYVLGSDSSKERAVFKVNRRVYSGGYKQSKEELEETCVRDVRINNGYFAMTGDEGRDGDAVAIVDENPNTREGCNRTDCNANKCVGIPNTVCYPLWGDFECRCRAGYHGPQCVSDCIPNPCYRNVTCVMSGSEAVCQCPKRWTGRLCNILAPEGVSSAGTDNAAIIAIIVSIIIVVLIAILVFLVYFKLCRNGDEGEKYILEVDPEDDIRENVMNYDEEGAGEKDQDAYDISRLQGAGETLNRPYDPDRRKDMPALRNAPGDKPDVGNFIDDRMRDADDDDNAPPHDSVREFNFEGGDSDAGSLSSLNTSSSDRSQDYDYLNEWGPKFSKLADMYGAGQDLPSS